MYDSLHAHTLPPLRSLEPEVSIIIDSCLLFHDIPQNHYSLDIGQVKVPSTLSLPSFPCIMTLIRRKIFILKGWR
jgi:hypothetical protein